LFGVLIVKVFNKMGIKLEKVGIVIIGRNEGERLKKCVSSALNNIQNIIYVDSGSSDGSIEYAELKGLTIVNLDTSIPFSAARARNEGALFLINSYPEIEYIQFIDGDCELYKGWLTSSYSFLVDNDSYAIATGRLKERYPENSIYNTLCDIEWDTPVGDINKCGGIFMIRKTAFEQISGFNPLVIAGEEPELCYRLIKNNWKIFRLDHLMALHDAAITRFSQWFKRNIRSGHAYTQGYFIHKMDKKGYCKKDSMRIIMWAFVFPFSVIMVSIIIHSFFLFLFLFYLIQIGKITRYKNKTLKNLKHSIVYGFFITLGRYPQLVGQLLFVKRKIFKKQYKIIE